MFKDSDFTEIDVNLMVLNFATRLLTLVTDKEALICVALETIADFSQSDKVAILTTREEGKTLKVEGLLSDRVPEIRKESLSLEKTPFSSLIDRKTNQPYIICNTSDIPVSEFYNTSQPKECLCMPIAATDGRRLGVTVIEMNEKDQMQLEDMQYMHIIMTYVAIALENVLLFSLVLVDGLTRLYVRQYYDVRVNEELARLQRRPGCVAVVMFDLDNFKTINDQFGHAAGDAVLKTFAGLLKENLRKDIDIICRYGGEEFIAIMPGAELEEAVNMSERIREKCHEHAVLNGENEIRYTVSGGVAATDSKHLISAEKLFGQVDAMLYRAKQAGRNRIEVWKEL